MVQTLAALFIALAIGHSLLARPGNAQEIKREALIEGAKREGKLQIYALLVVSDHMQIIQRFKDKYPFIDVALYRATSERLFTRIETEARANTHLVDVIGISGFQMYQLVKRGLLGKYESPERRHYEPGFKDKEGHWTAYYVNPLVTAHNTRQVAAQDAPKGLCRPAGPEMEGQTGNGGRGDRMVFYDDELLGR